MTDTVEILDRLIAFDTVSNRSNLELISYIEHLLRENGFQLTRIPSPDSGKAGLFAQIGPEIDGGILLSAHTDVVPTTNQNWTRAPFEMSAEGDRLYGRGTTDMKGFLACMLSLAGRAAKSDLKAPLKFVLSYDEEIGCVGIAEMQDRLAPLLGSPNLCIVGEPTEMMVAIGHKGKMAMSAEFAGQSGHSALAPRFVNALHLAGDFMSELRLLQSELEQNGSRDPAYAVPFSTIHVGKLSGGQALNIVPDKAKMEFELRHLTENDARKILDRIKRIIRDVEGAHIGGGVSFKVKNAYPGLETPADSQAVRYVQDLSGNAVIKVAFGTEAGKFASLGFPTLVCGPGSMEGQGHKADEYIERSQLELCDSMLDKLLLDLT